MDSIAMFVGVSDIHKRHRSMNQELKYKISEISQASL
jgi:hypothetical protein